MDSKTAAGNTTSTRVVSTGAKLSLFLLAMRPKQWVKNGFVFAALISSVRFLDAWAIAKVLVAFVTFCALSSGIYLLNDIVDAQKDRLHPRKCVRPIASGHLRKGEAAAAAILLSLSALAVGFRLEPQLGFVLLAYFLLNLSYSFWLKKIVLLDILIIASGFVLRALAGAAAIPVYVSPWLLVVTGFLAIFLALTKRRAELLLLAKEAAASRPVLSEYSVTFLDQMIIITSTASLISYAIYTFNSTHSDKMMLTIPFVIYGIFRYLYLVHQQGMGGSPEQLLLSDRPFQVNLILYVATVMTILAYFNGTRL